MIRVEVVEEIIRRKINGMIFELMIDLMLRGEMSLGRRKEEKTEEIQEMFALVAREMSQGGRKKEM